MKNAIFKNFSKKILKSQAFVSFIIVAVLAIGIIGTSYALYMDVDTDTNYQLVNIGDLAVSFNNGENTIELENMLPMDNDIALEQKDNLFSFYIYNKGTYIANYDIKLVPNDDNEIDMEYINYQLCVDNLKSCEEINTLSNTKDNIVYTDELNAKKQNDSSNPSAYYFLRVWVNNKYKSNVKKKIGLKVVIEVRNAKGTINNKNTLANNILTNNNIIINDKKATLFDKEINEVGLYKINDNDGISYYFRGNSRYNYINFANMCFRVVRILGNGSTKLVLEDKDNTCENSNINYIVNNLDEFKDSKLNNYLEKLDNIWYIDNEVYSDELGNNLTDFTNETYYYKSYINLIKNKIDNIIYNDKIENYVGSLSSDEIILAGASLKENNENYYLNNKNNYYLINNSNYNNKVMYKYAIIDGLIKEVSSNNNIGYRPSIILNKDILYNNGDGSKENPYTIK